jgi:tetratricopeptide (TPR) repeat protein
MAKRKPDRESPTREEDVAVSIRSAVSGRKRRLFAIAAIALSLLFIASIEGALRLCGFGGYPPTIVQAGPTPAGTLCYTDNPGPASYFFANKSRPGSVNTYTFHSPKPKGTVRIVLAGESAAKGFPQSMAFASSAFLETMLRDLWPDRKVEVINLGTTAVASFPVLDMLTESLDYEPDLAVVYVGNNEFYGTYGVASLHAAGSAPWALRASRRFRSTAILQGIEWLMTPQEIGDPSKTLMEIMIGQSHVAPQSPLRAAAARNLKSQVLEMISRCKSRGVPLIVCTSPSNERDLAPLGTSERSDSAAEATLKEILAQNPDDPLANYLLGRARFAQKDFGQASVYFQKAIDLDPMPWRCPGQGNQALQEAATEGGAVLCDLRNAFRSASPGGCIGWELMDDHVHPTLAGQILIARTIVTAMSGLSGSIQVRPDQVNELASDETYFKRLGDNIYDRYAVAYTIRELCNISFVKETNPHAYDRFNRIMHDLESRMAPEVLKVARSWQEFRFHARAQRPISGMVGRALIRLGDFSQAEQLYELARRAVALYSSWNLEYEYFRLVCRERTRGKLDDADLATAAEAIERGKFLLARGHSESGMAERYCGRLHQLRCEWNEAIPFLLTSRPKVTGSDLVAVDQALVMSYVAVGRRADAMKLIDAGIQHSGEFAHLYRQMRKGMETSATMSTTTQPVR